MQLSTVVGLGLTVLAGLGSAGCSQGTDPSGDLSGRYDARIDVSDGRVIRGTLDLTIRPDSTITGTKSLSLEGGAATGLEPLLEGGEVEGRVYADRVVIHLNPRYADHNYWAEGEPDGDRVRGQVTHVGFTGAVEPVGTFEARRR